jgi:hypothetical protein
VAATVGLIVLGVGGGMLSVSALMAQSSASPPQSAKSPATQPAELLDPKAVLLQFAAAIKRNDAMAVRSLVHAEGQDPQQILELACDYVVTSGDFKAAIKEKFGAETLAKMSRGMNLSPIDQFAIFVDRVADKLELAIDGDEATLKAPEISSDVFYMVRHEGRWKLSADRMTESWSPDAWEQRTAQVRFASEAIRSLTQNLQNGQYATPADLQRDIQMLLNQGR